jgi:hypothetical protein
MDAGLLSAACRDSPVYQVVLLYSGHAHFPRHHYHQTPWTGLTSHIQLYNYTTTRLNMLLTLQTSSCWPLETHSRLAIDDPRFNALAQDLT